MRVATKRQLLGVSGLAALAIVASLLSSPRAILTSLETLASRPVLFALAVSALYLVRPFLLWPVTSVAVLLGYLFGPAAGFGLAILGAAFTALPPYLLGRYARTDMGLFSHVGETCAEFFQTVGDCRGVIAARFSPVPGDPISYAAGLSGVAIGPFLAGTMVGEVPWAVVAVFAGASMRTLSLADFTVSIELVVALCGLAVLLLVGPAYSRYSETEQLEPEPSD